MIATEGRIEGYRLKPVDIDEKWYILKLTLGAKNVSADVLTKLSGTAVLFCADPAKADKKIKGIKALTRLEGYRCAPVDGDEKYYTVELAIPSGSVSADALTELACMTCALTIEPAQEELPFGGRPKGKAKARGKAKPKGSKKDEPGLGV